MFQNAERSIFLHERDRARRMNEPRMIEYDIFPKPEVVVIQEPAHKVEIPMWGMIALLLLNAIIDLPDMEEGSIESGEK